MAVPIHYLHLKNVSRSFYLNTMILPLPLRDYVAVAYLFCRILDTIEDDPQMPIATKQALMTHFFLVLAQPVSSSNFLHDDWGTLIAPLTATKSENLLLADFLPLAALFWQWDTIIREILLTHMKIMGAGMLRYCRQRNDQGPHFLTDWQQFDDYCYVVAGVVGEMLTALFSHQWKIPGDGQQQLIANNIAFGHALQSTNIIKDFFSDYQRGICFWPTLPLHPSGPQLATMLTIMITRTIPSLLAAEVYYHQLPWRAWRGKIFCLWPLVFAYATLTKILQHQTDYLAGKVIKISRRQVKWIIYGTFFAIPVPFAWGILLVIYRRRLQQELTRRQEPHA